jgi:hypothetical protein
MTSGKTGDSEKPRVVKGDQNFQLDRETFRARLLERFNDPGFETVSEHLEKVIDVAWGAYMGYRKSPRTRKAGPEFADPEYKLPIEWLETRRKVNEAQARHDAPNPPRGSSSSTAPPAAIRRARARSRRPIVSRRSLARRSPRDPTAKWTSWT